MGSAYAETVLARECFDAIAGARDHVIIEVPEGWRAPKGFPRRELMCVNGKGESVYRVRAERLLGWLIRTRLLTVKTEDGPEPEWTPAASRPAAAAGEEETRT